MSAVQQRPTVRVGEAGMRVFSPASPLLTEAPGAGAPRHIAPRLASLDGLVLAIVDNGFNSPLLPDAIVRQLRREAAIADVVWVKKDSVSVPPRPEDWEEVVNRATAGLALYGG